jgi:hypothetical protein
MPDTRTRRGPHPKDESCFAPEQIPTLRAAVRDLSWLQTRGYSDKASLKLVGDRYSLRDRQRKALQRCAASDQACLQREQNRVPASDLGDEVLVVDGYNVLLTVEAALSDGVLLLARDSTLRDLAAMSGHYRRVHTTKPAVELLAEFVTHHGCAGVEWYLDRPVSNSARLKRLIEQIVADRSPPWLVRLTDQTDKTIIDSEAIVASADSAILDRCDRWVNLARLVVESSIPDAWIVDLTDHEASPKPS